MLSKFIALSQKEFEERDGSDFEDDRQIASWAKDAVEMLRRQSIVEGDEENMFNPEDQLTRAQAAKLITVILKRYNEIASR
jgi:uncharacterized membrane protein